MAHTGLFGGQLSTKDTQRDDSKYRGTSYVLYKSSFFRLGASDFTPSDAQRLMDQLATKVKAYYQKSGQTITIGDSYDTDGARRLPLAKGSGEFLSVVHAPPGEGGRRGTISIQIENWSAEPNTDPEVKELLKALGAKL